MPGPMLMLVLGQVADLRHGRGLGHRRRHAVLEIIIVLLLVAGLRPILQRPVCAVPWAWSGAVMAWSGCWMMLQADSVAPCLRRPAAESPWVLLLAQGAWVSITNPYFTGWWATIGSGAAHRRALQPARVRRLLPRPRAVGPGLVRTGRSGGAHRGDLVSPTVYTWLILVSGAVLVALSLWFIWTGIRFIWLGAGDDAANLPTAEIMGEVCAGAGAGAPGTEEDP